ncbi:MAG: hypothetical protein AAFR11_04540 [Pseudomonadota bacterium]
MFAIGFIAALAVAAAFDEEPAGVVPAEMCGTYFIVSVVLESESGKPEADRTLDFIYDTGASGSLVDPDSIERVSGVRVPVGKRAVFRNASAGDVSYNKLPARVGEFDHISRALGRPVDGLLAYDAFGPYLVTLDYEAGEIRLGRGELPKPDGKTVFNARGKDERPWVKVKLGGRRERLLVDSGARNAVAVNDLDKYEVVGEPAPLGAAIRIKRIEKRVGARLAGSLNFGDVTFDRPIAEKTPGNQLLGAQVLQHFEITLDNKNRRIRFIQRTPGRLTSPPRRETGAFMKPTDEGFEIFDIVEGSAAADAGLEVGDVLTAFDGAPAFERGCPRRRDGIDERPAEIVLTRSRDDEEQDVRLDLSEPVIP